MRFLAFVAAMSFSWGAPAEPPPPHIEGADTIEVRQCDPWPCIFYANDGSENSREQVVTFDVSGTKVDVRIEVTAAHEIITVIPHDEMVEARPRSAKVADGDNVEIHIILPLF